jgi:hypothetical protein
MRLAQEWYRGGIAGVNPRFIAHAIVDTSLE